MWLAPDFVEVAFDPDIYSDFCRKLGHVPGMTHGFEEAMRSAQLNLGGWRSQRFIGEAKIALLRETARVINELYVSSQLQMVENYAYLIDALKAPPIVDLLARLT